MLPSLLKKVPAFARVIEKLQAGKVTVEGAWGSSAAMIAAGIRQALKRPLLYIVAHVDEAEDVLDDLALFGATDAAVLPAFDSATSPNSEAAADTHVRRLTVLDAAASRPKSNPAVLVAPVAALIHGVPEGAAMAGHMLALSKGLDLSPDRLVRWLVEHKFEPGEMVEVPGDFARRGGIVDVFPMGSDRPVRVEYFGDTIDGIRLIDMSDQHSLDEVPAVTLFSAPPPIKPGDGNTIALSRLPADTVCVLREPNEIREVGRNYIEKLKDSLGLYPVEAVLRFCGKFPTAELTTFGKGGGEDKVGISIEALPQMPREPAKAIAELQAIAQRNRVLLFCESAEELKSLKPVVGETESGRQVGGLEFHEGMIHQGFRLAESATVLIGQHELFHRRAGHTPLRAGQTRPIDSFLDLQAGDYVVHVNHGIGRFKSLQTVRRAGRAEEVLVIEYAGNAALQVPVDQINLVQKYIGGFKGGAVLNRLGGTAWEKQKAKVGEAVSDLAIELLNVQAERAGKPGVAYPPDTAYQREFEASFAYTETPDQLRALAEIKADMESPRPMDRLLCGDVGYGKTELAVRAAFKAAEYGKQVAVLVPTTVLAEQHYRTFKDRLDGFPFRVEVVSRFRTAKEQRDIVAETRAGRVDILIGTHRLLSKDVVFADLGLLVIDEEQRFGVEHKERMKMLKKTVDVLTLTATPLPRTLHLSTLGLRDISSLATAPVDRRSIYTEVTRYDEEKIRNALERELTRGGQAYFVHNRVYDIISVADNIRRIYPSAKVGIGHGQMHEDELEDAMMNFINKVYDILVCTTIIESGLDIRNANTIFIHDADMFGLADLHQLRGRVGRYKNRAYCYLLLPQERPMTSTSQRRLKAIEDYSELGAGFRIAMRDLEIRGAGNILGSEQSGHIASVGYEMYCQLLEETVRKLKNAPAPVKREAKIDLGVDLYLPKGWIESDRQRMEAYRKITRCADIKDLNELSKELADRFGPLPAAARTVIDVNELRILASMWKMTAVVLQKPDVVFTVTDLSVLGPLFAKASGVVRVADAQTVHLRMPANYLEPTTLIPVLRKLMGAPTSA